MDTLNGNCGPWHFEPRVRPCATSASVRGACVVFIILVWRVVDAERCAAQPGDF